MKLILSAILPLAFAGCLSSAPKDPAYWSIDVDDELAASEVRVAAPFDGQRLAVLRGDGTVAFDGFNTFAARPAALVRAAVREDRRAPRLFVRHLALDCRRDGERKAFVDLMMERKDLSVARAAASVDAADGNYSRAFGEAFLEAAATLRQELGR